MMHHDPGGSSCQAHYQPHTDPLRSEQHPTRLPLPQEGPTCSHRRYSCREPSPHIRSFRREYAFGPDQAVVEAWYPAQAGGQAIAEILTGAVNPSGRLPVTFPADLAQTPRPDLSGLGTPWGTPVTIEYAEGAEVGYRWFAQQHQQPLYAFGHGLSYTTFDYAHLHVEAGDTITATFTVTNTGQRAGADVPQLYVTAAAGEERLRLLGFQRVELQPGESRQVTITADRRLLARFDGPDGITGTWRIAEGTYQVAVGKSAHDLVLTADTPMRSS